MVTERFVEFKSGRNILRGMIHRPRRPDNAVDPTGPRRPDDAVDPTGPRRPDDAVDPTGPRRPDNAVDPTGPRTGGNSPAVVLLHGFTGQRMGSHFILVKTARALAEGGIAALRFDFAGSGESQGRFQDMSVLTELDDARRALAYVAKLRGVDRTKLGVLGHSLGGCVAGMLLEDPRLTAGVLWAAVADLTPLVEATAPPLAQEQLARKGYIEYAAHRIGRAFVEDARTADPASAIGRSAADVLIVHGTKDEAVPLEHARALARAARQRRNGARTELALVRDADHTFERIRHEEEVIALSVEWFKKSFEARGRRSAPPDVRSDRGRAPKTARRTAKKGKSSARGRRKKRE